MKIDFKDFFPSLNARDWHLYCLQNSVFPDPEDIRISSNVLFHRMRGSTTLKLAIGAPTSPLLSNILMYEFDQKISSNIDKRIAYTRYADDITFSAPRTGFLLGVEKMVRQLLRELTSPSLKINAKKTLLATPKYKRMVTGLILATDGRVTIGRRRKRELRVAMNYAKDGKLETEDLKRLSGWLSFISDVEPAALESLKRSYGEDLIRRVWAVSSGP